MVDIQNHEESLKELCKTSLVNNLTLILCWSAQEAGRYLELYKSYEHASPTSIRAHQATSYSEKLVEFITVPRSINKTDAVGLVSAFGSVRAAVNARPEEIGIIAGWGEKKVQRWCETVRENFRVKKAAKRGLALERADSSRGLTREDSLFGEGTEDTNTPVRLGVGAPIPVGLVPSREVSSLGEQRAGATPDAERRSERRVAEDVPMWEPGEDEEEALLLTATEEKVLLATQEKGSSNITGPKKAITNEEELSEGIMTALAKLRD